MGALLGFRVSTQKGSGQNQDTDRNHFGKSLCRLVRKALINVAIEELEELRRALRPLGWLVRYTLDRTNRI